MINVSSTAEHGIKTPTLLITFNNLSFKLGTQNHTKINKNNKKRRKFAAFFISIKQYYSASGRMCGNKRTSLIVDELVNNITKRSIPIPSPAVGGKPNSSARI